MGRRIENQTRAVTLGLYDVIDGDLTVAAALADLEDALRVEVGNAALADHVNALARQHQAKLITDRDVEFQLRAWADIGATSETW